MPALNLRTLMSEATASAGGRVDISLSQASLLANLAQLEVASMLPHGEMESTDTLSIQTSGYTAALPADFGETISLSRVSSFDNFGYRALTAVPIHQVDNASEGTATGTPNRYAIFNQQVVLYPTASSPHSLVFRYRKVPADMTALTDLPSLHTRYHPAVLYKLTETLCDRVLDSERAAYYRNKFISVMQTIPSTPELRTRSERTS